MTCISGRDVLDVLIDFDPSGGASVELVAWELNCEPDDVTPFWRQFSSDGLIAEAGRDTIMDEPVYRLSPPGWVQAGAPA